MSKVNEAMKNKAYQLCQQFLGGTWSDVTKEEFHIEPVTGGLSNILYQCVLPESLPLQNGEPRRVLLRLYGQIILDNPETALIDPLIFGILAARNVGPNVYGVFPEGRLEQFIPSRPLRTTELHIPEISRDCARIMAKFHTLTMPLRKSPTWLFSTIQDYLDNSLSCIASDDYNREKSEKIRQIFAYDLANEVDSLKSLLAKVDSPVVFCHNDFQEGNILFVDSKGAGKEDGKKWEVRPIDFEYCSYNYRGFDLGNHFCEWCYDYTIEDHPYFTANLEQFPTRQEQVNFIRAYLEDDNKNTTADEDTIEHLLLEANAFALASHMLWALWSIVQSKMSTINFSYLDYALARLKHYKIQKTRILDMLPNITQR